MKSTTFALTALASFAFANADVWRNNTETTTHTHTDTETEFTTLTGYTTYCPESTIITITTCEDHHCAPHTYTVHEPSTLTITEECVFPSSDVHTEHDETTSTKPAITTFYTTYCPEPTVVTITTCNENKCAPHEYTVTTPTTLTVTEDCIPPSVTIKPEEPKPTTVKPEEPKPTTVKPEEPKPDTVETKKTTSTTESPVVTTTDLVSTTLKSVTSSLAPKSTAATVSTYEGGAAKVAAGFVGFAGMVALFV